MEDPGVLVIHLDPSGGLCGNVGPDGLTCAIPINNFGIHMLFNQHMAIDGDGVHFGWPLKPSLEDHSK